MTTHVKRMIVAALKTIEEESLKISNDAKKPPSRQGKKTLVSHVNPAAAWQLKKLALDQSTTVQKLLDEALADLFEKYHLPRL